MDFHWKLLRDYTCLHCCRVVLVCIVHCDFFRLMMFLVQSGSMHGRRKSEDFGGCACFWRAFLKFLVWITLVVHLLAVGCAYIFLFLTPDTRIAYTWSIGVKTRHQDAFQRIGVVWTHCWGVGIPGRLPQASRRLVPLHHDNHQLDGIHTLFHHQQHAWRSHLRVRCKQQLDRLHLCMRWHRSHRS